MQYRKSSRREALKIGAAAAAGAVFAPSFSILRAGVSPNERLNVAVVGFGQRGHHVLRGFWLRARDKGEVNIVAIADPNLKSGHDWIGAGDEPWHDKWIAEVDGQVAAVPRFQDYRVMLDKMERDIDAVLIFAVCNHHFPASMHAMQRGKHVFVEKPMCMTVEEARRMRLEAAKQKVVTQMGIQGHGSGGGRMLREWVRKGLLGEIHEVHCTGGRPANAKRPEKGDPVPDTLDYDTWLGPAPEGPFHKSFITRRGWCSYLDFTIGSWGETFIHSFEGAFCGLDVRSPQTVSLIDEPGGEAIVLAYPARGKLPPVKFVIHQRSSGQVEMVDRIPFPKEMDAESRTRVLSHHSFAHVFVPGTKYTAYIQGYSTVRILPYESMREFAKQHGKLHSYCWPEGHYGSFLAACKAGNPEGSSANFEYAGPLMETICLLNVVSRIRKKGKILEWDAENVRFKNDDDANQLVRRAYRRGWEIEET